MLGSYVKVLLLNEPYYMYTACARSSMHIHLHNHFTMIRSSVLDTIAVHLLQYCYRGQDICQGVLAAFRPGSSYLKRNENEMNRISLATLSVKMGK